MSIVMLKLEKLPYIVQKVNLQSVQNFLMKEKYVIKPQNVIMKVPKSVAVLKIEHTLVMIQ